MKVHRVPQYLYSVIVCGHYRLVAVGFVFHRLHGNGSFAESSSSFPLSLISPTLVHLVIGPVLSQGHRNT